MMFFIWYCDSCPWLARSQLVFHVAITIAEMHYPLPHCANIHCFPSINVQQAPVDVSGFNTFHLEQFNDCLCFIYTFMSDSVLSDCPSGPSVTQPQNLMEYWQEGWNSTAIPPKFSFVIMGQHNKIKGIINSSTLTIMKKYSMNNSNWEKESI